MKWGILMTMLSIAFLTGSGCTSYKRLGLSYSKTVPVDGIRLLVDETWTDKPDRRYVEQEIFDGLFELIDQAEKFILLDLFLVNDFLYEPGSGMRPLSGELFAKLLEKRRNQPEVEIVFISDPVNTLYGSIESEGFKQLEAAGVRVVWTNLDRMRDSNPIYSKVWRLLFKWWGTAPGDAVENPLGEGRISRRSMLRLLNFKANHRKVVLTEKSLLVSSANPHDASSAHWNVALRLDGFALPLAWESESAVLRMSGAGDIQPPEFNVRTMLAANRHVSLVTERSIKEQALGLLDHAQPGDRIDLAMFYFSDRDLMRAFIAAHKRGCAVRIILDPSKDAFGKIKNGIPNRQTAYHLNKAGIPLRWADTHGEQCHVKMLYVEKADGTATFLSGSGNYTRRNINNFNLECDLAYTAPQNDETFVRLRKLFDRWWSNPDGRIYTTDYATYADPSLRRRIRCWFMETFGFSTF